MKKIGISANGCPSCGAWSTELFGYTKSGLEMLGCECGFHFEAAPISLRHLYKVEKVRYPQHNLSMGVTVTSRDHENYMAKKLGMVPSDQLSIAGRRPKRTRKKMFKAAKI